MRVLWLLFLLLLIGAIGVFALQNHEIITLHFLGWTTSWYCSLLIGLVYLLGMVSGWTVIGLVQRSLRRVSAQSPA